MYVYVAWILHWGRRGAKPQDTGPTKWRLVMVQILTVASGTPLLRPGIAALHAAGYRVTMYDVASVRDLHCAAPDLLILAADSAKTAYTSLAEIRTDAALQSLPVIVVGESWETFE